MLRSEITVNEDEEGVAGHGIAVLAPEERERGEVGFFDDTVSIESHETDGRFLIEACVSIAGLFEFLVGFPELLVLGENFLVIRTWRGRSRVCRRWGVPGCRGDGAAFFGGRGCAVLQLWAICVAVDLSSLLSPWPQAF